MGAFETLKQRGNVRGVAVRPRGSDNHKPPPGTRVEWVVAQPVQDMVDQGKKLGLHNVGTIGNVDHLRKHGDHTPWSAGKQRHIVYAKDTSDPPWLEKHLLRLCRKDDYDTTWIDFINVNGSQYNFAGVRLGDSGDFHLHISVRAGHELTRVTLFRDIDRLHRKVPLTTPRAVAAPKPKGPLMSLTDAEQKRLLAQVSETRFMLGSDAAELGHPFQIDRKEWSSKLDAILKAVTGDDTPAILASIKDQGDQTRAALLGKIDQIAPGLAAAVVDKIGGEVTASEIAEALSDELAQRLAG
jgi:hypothetical protein